MKSNVYILAGGGSGGHLYPGLAVAEELRRLDERARVVFLCSSRPIDRRILDPTGWAIVPQPVRPMPRRLRQWPGFALSLAGTIRTARRLMRRLQPRAVLGLGGFAAAPATWWAARAGFRTAMLNPDAIPGKANRGLSRHVEAIFTQFDVSREHFCRTAQEHVQRVGCPARRELLGGSRTEAMRHFGLLPSRKTLLVFGGSQSAASIDGAVAALFDQLKALGRRWQVLAIGGNESARLAELNDKETHLRFRWRPYCDRMDLAYAAADLALCRAGASSVAELTATGTPAVFMPYPWHRDQHQRSNAGPLAEARAAVICIDEIDPAINAQTLGPALLAIMNDDEKLQAMTDAARSFGSADAAEQVARWLVRQQ